MKNLKSGASIPVKDAEGYIENYLAYLASLSQTGQTQSVGFDLDNLNAWLIKIGPYSDEIRVVFGVYPQDHIRAGKLMVMLWPYKNGNPAVYPTLPNGTLTDGEQVEPYNIGDAAP